MNLSINPSYYCNFNCDFCYLTSEQLKDKNKISPEKLDELLKQLVQYEKIDHVDLYGGEIMVLPDDYYNDIKKIIKKYYNSKINIITNFSVVDDKLFEDDITLSVSYDFEARQQHDRVFTNIMMSKKPISVLILANKNVIDMSVDYMVNMLNMSKNIISVEIKPYSINQSNNHNVSHLDFENFVKRWLECKTEKKFQFINKEKIIKSLSKEYNAFSNDHVYITPNGKFGVLEFDLNDREYFLELDKFEDYLKWAKLESLTNLSDVCRKCEYYGHCLTEHYRYVKDLDKGCNGYKGLLNYYARMEN